MDKKINITFTQAMGMIYPYFKTRVMEQISAVWLIILYLVAFQTLILGMPIAQASLVSIGIALVVIGLTFFMEGLLLGLMPLGETIGVKLPQKSKLPVILVFAFLLGFGATFAEPAVGVLKAAGSSVKAWDAPLLFLLLNKYSDYLVYAVGAGVGIAVLLGMLRFMYSWSLKPFIYVLVILLSGLSIYAYYEPNLIYVSGLAWDCGGVTTGPVTVPLVIALGVGITRIVSKGGDSGAGGFGVVTLASALPVLTVLLLGMLFMNSVSKPMPQEEFFSTANAQKAEFVFENKEQMIGYMLLNANAQTALNYFGSKDALNSFLSTLKTTNDFDAVFGNKQNFNRWFTELASQEQRVAVFGADAKAKLTQISEMPMENIDLWASLKANFLVALQAIIPLSLFLFFMLTVILREKLKRSDEIAAGLGFAVLGMALFGIGIEFGLSNLGNQAGSKLPAAFKSVELTDQKQTLKDFNLSLTHTAITPDGKQEQFFYAKINGEYQAVPHNPQNYDEQMGHYTHTPVKKPIFGGEGNLLGIVVVLMFAFIMGYGATLAEPALNALGLTVEELTVGAFKKSALIQTVAVGVGLGLALGVAKIIWNIPLIYLLVPPYLVLLFITYLSSEDFVNIGWDSAGVTTGPITVPLVLAMGLGIGNSVGVVEGFGVLAMASVMPILAVLLMGLIKNRAAKGA